MARSVAAIIVIDVAAFCVAAPMLVWPVMGADKSAAVPDLAGSWARATFALEQPASGPGPLRNPNRLGGVAAGGSACEKKRLDVDFRFPRVRLALRQAAELLFWPASPVRRDEKQFCVSSGLTPSWAANQGTGLPVRSGLYVSIETCRADTMDRSRRDGPHVAVGDQRLAIE